MNPSRPSRHRNRLRRPLAVLCTVTALLGTGLAATAPADAQGTSPDSPVLHVHPGTTPPKDATQRVIVVMRDQSTATIHGRSASALDSHAAAVGKAQVGISQRLHDDGARNVHRYDFVNAVSATVSPAVKNQLTQDPSVLAVVPDRTISLHTHTDKATSGVSGAAASANRTPGLCGTRQRPLVEPEALRQIDAASQHDHGANGSGVKIAVFPDGVDPDIQDFIRPDGRHVVFDYKDFTGDGPDGVTGGAEAFGDVSAIAAQGRTTYDLSKVVNPNLALPKNCDARIKGVAPGAQVAVMKVFGQTSASESTILQGLDYAVMHDHVDVLSQSFGSSSIPTSGQDPIAMFDAAAVRAGISVVVSSGDAGTTNTVGSPAADADGVISVGATTSFREHAQLSEHGYQLGGDHGWEDDNIASLSSAGFTSYGPNSVDLVAPGDGGWADCSNNTSTFLECANPFGAGADAPPVQSFGGTSQSAPLVAGVAALVIQAYRSTHHGATPAPRVVKSILTSTATDLHAPVEEQGAGQVDASRAVEAARAYKTSSRTGDGSAVLSTTKISTTAAPGSTHRQSVTVRNDGRHAVTLRPSLKAFTAPKTIASTSVDYQPGAAGTKSFTYWLDGKPQPYAETDFRVPAGYQRLDARIGFPAQGIDGTNEAFVVLFDPHGRLAQDSDPQGAGSGFGQADVRDPAPGTWRAIIFARPASGGYSGPVSFSATVQKLATVHGSHLPRLTVPAHGTRSLPVSYTLPTTPGDSSAGVYFGHGIGVLPVLMRATVPVTSTNAGHFSGTLTGGNGRPVLGAQTQTYQFQVPKGMKDVDVDVHLDQAAFDTAATLVAPDGKPVDSQTTDFEDMTSPFGSFTNEKDVHLSWRAPASGLWELELFTFGGDSSGKTGVGFTGTVAFDTVHVTSSGLPDDPHTVLTAGTPTTAQVTVKNTGDAPETYYIDPRLDQQKSYPLGFATTPDGTVGKDTAQILVPPETSSAVIAATADAPIQFSTGPMLGDPQLLSTTGKTAVVGLKGPIEAGEWSCGPSLIGPFTAAAPTTTFDCSGLATTAAINNDVKTTGGNLWDMVTDEDAANYYDPQKSAVVQPGQSATLTVRLTPAESESGTVVSGHLAVQTLNMITLSSDELVNLPYEYAVASGS